MIVFTKITLYTKMFMKWEWEKKTKENAKKNSRLVALPSLLGRLFSGVRKHRKQSGPTLSGRVHNIMGQKKKTGSDMVRTCNKLVLLPTEILQNPRAKETRRLLYLRDTGSHVVQATTQHHFCFIIIITIIITIFCFYASLDITTFYYLLTSTIEKKYLCIEHISDNTIFIYRSNSVK